MAQWKPRVGRRLVAATAAVVEHVERRLLMSAGQLDRTFATTGVIQVAEPTVSPTVAYSATAVQPDGRVLLAETGNGGAFAKVVRYTATGATDPTFGTGGSLTLSAAAFGTGADPRLIIEPGGSILFAAGSGLVQLTPAGAVDPTFGGAGTGYVAFPAVAGSGPVLGGMALQVDGNILVTLNAQLQGGTNAVVARYLAGGLPDASYGTAGVTSLATVNYARVEVGGVAVDAAGGAIVTFGVTLTPAATVTPGFDSEFALERLLPAGTVDPSFGTGGTVTTAANVNEADTSDVAIAPDGTIYQAATFSLYLSTTNAVGVLTAYSPAGTTYGAETSGSFALGFLSVSVQSDGKPVVLGYSFDGPPTGNDLFAERFLPLNSPTATGGIDASFNPGTTDGGNGVFLYGLTLQAFGNDQYGQGDVGWSLALEADGSAFLAGTSVETSVAYDLLKLQPDPALAAGVGSVGGVTYSDDNGNGGQDGGEGPLVDYPVFLDANNDGLFDAGDVRVYTDENGNYTFIGLTPGTDHLVQTLPAGQTHTEPAGINVYAAPVTAGVASVGFDFGVAGTSPSPTPTPSPTTSGSIVGTVFLDNSGDGVQQSAEPGLYDWGVYLDLNNDGVRDAGDVRVFTSAAGKFAFTGLAAGTYAVRQNTPVGYRRTTAAFPVTVTVAADAARTVNIGNQYTGSGGAITTGGQITGFVFDDSNADGLLDDGEGGLAGFGVYLDLNHDGAYDAGDDRAIAAADGSYTFNDLPAGTYAVRQNTPAGYVLTTPAFPVSVTITQKQVALVNIGNRLVGSGSIAGTVFLDANGNATQQAAEPGLDGFGVYLDNNDDGTFDAGDVRVFTNTLGQYTFGSLTPGTYVLRENIPAGYTLTTAPVPDHGGVDGRQPSDR